MDRKTLEYLEDRAKQGREIVNKIEHLQKIKRRSTNVSTIILEDFHGNHLGSIRKSSRENPDQSRLVDKTTLALHNEIDEEIATLEKELGEL